MGMNMNSLQPDYSYNLVGYKEVVLYVHIQPEPLPKMLMSAWIISWHTYMPIYRATVYKKATFYQ